MLIDRVLFPISSLGPGNRLVIWTVGCSKHCDGCSNKELWLFDKNKNIPVDELIKFIEQYMKKFEANGITITGGDPLEQYDELMVLVKELRTYTDDILVYTGFTIEELEAKYTIEKFNEIKENISVLIDGRYINFLNDNKSTLRGSTNQRIHIFNDGLKPKYDDYIKKGRTVQNVFCNSKIISVGIHNKED